jgi:G3E family GTPase
MKIIVFGGFLGSGKTSLIISLARFIVDMEQSGSKPEANNKQEAAKLVIIENEIGKTGIDDKLLKKSGFEVRELFAGCICCTLANDLTSAVNQLAEETDVPWVIVECTGLAYPGRLIETLGKYGRGIESIRTVSVVDTERWDRLLGVTPELIQSQVSDGDIVLINKTDLASEKVLDKVENEVRGLNPEAFIQRVSAISPVDDSIWRRVTDIA